MLVVKGYSSTHLPGSITTDSCSFVEDFFVKVAPGQRRSMIHSGISDRPEYYNPEYYNPEKHQVATDSVASVCFPGPGAYYSEEHAVRNLANQQAGADPRQPCWPGWVRALVAAGSGRFRWPLSITVWNASTITPLARCVIPKPSWLAQHAPPTDVGKKAEAAITFGPAQRSLGRSGSAFNAFNDGPPFCSGYARYFARVGRDDALTCAPGLDKVQTELLECTSR